MKFTQQRQCLIIAPYILLALGLFTYWRPQRKVRNQGPVFTSEPHGQHRFDGSWNYERDRNNLLLTHGQCDQAFPGLFAEIDRVKEARSLHTITAKEIDTATSRSGTIRAMLYDQQLYIITKERTVGLRGMATLAAINRAVITSSEPLPNIEFGLNIDDQIEDVALWGTVRRPEDESIWLIPDFDYSSSDKSSSIKETLLKVEIAEKEDALTWENKTNQLLWRGDRRKEPDFRDQLVKLINGRPWADVKDFRVEAKGSMENQNKILPEHCNYKFIAQTEEKSDSGLKHLQMCRSVVVSDKLDWVQHYYHLLRSSGSQQNFVEVEHDWSDLEEKMEWLLNHDNDAKRIADNSVKIFRERYLTPAAEVCYWRRLIQEWARVSDFEPELYEEYDGKKSWRGVDVERFFLMQSTRWES
ncbi:CAZyme family GT90 [Penicillium cinerascens]|uniref:CAZyme family GT90 n=1 Tax=Penicillium cinerascens TaxID=70096 RepID=A0A9W9MNK2_9EURO|nr:CAZyme family GT90 [Penicillium cinerascens]KAJ5204442.1 CAZyme family GT90 [Penicillium cinerascens]